MNSTTPAGWYPDPQNASQQRYWDGTAWTEHTAPLGQQPSMAHGSDVPMHVGPEAGNQNWFVRHKALSAALAVFLIIVIAGAAAGSEDENPTGEAAGGASTSQTSGGSGGDAGSDDPKSSPEPKTKSEPKPKPKPKPQAIAVTAGKLVKEFDENELAADSKYKGKALKVTGVVDKIDTDIFDDEKYILQLGSGGQYEFFTVNCNDMSTDELATLNKGDKVTVVGEFDDGGDLGVEVKNCKLA